MGEPGVQRTIAERRIAACVAAFVAALLALAPAAASDRDGRAPADPVADAALVRRLVAAGVPARPLQRALRAYACGRAAGAFDAQTERILTLVDYTRPSAERRLWVLDLDRGAVRFHERVAHGRESGLGLARRFSNVPGSRQSSLGLFRTGETYDGRHGYSLRLEGLEPGTNDRALERGIVVHGADYATPRFAAKHGRLGRSWGCPALDPAIHRDVIDTIRDGTALFAHYPDPDWLDRSPFLHCETLARTVTPHQSDGMPPRAASRKAQALAAAIALGCRIRASVSPISWGETCGRFEPAPRDASRAMSASEITPSS